MTYNNVPYIKLYHFSRGEMAQRIFKYIDIQFSFHGPTVWNSLPSALRDDSLSLNTFSRRLKAYLFGQ